MFKIILFASVFALFSSNIVYSIPAFADDDDEIPEFVSDQVIVSFRLGITEDDIEEIF